MFRVLGFVTVFLPPLVVFLLEIVQFSIGGSISIPMVALIYPVGILTFLAYSLFQEANISEKDHYLDFSKGARFATFATVFGSASVVALPVFAGEPFLGPALLFVSIGSIWMPSALAAALYGFLLSTSEMQPSQSELTGTKHGGTALLFLAWLLNQKAFLRSRSKDVRFIYFLAVSYALGWLYVSLAGGFPYSAFGAVMLLLVPLGSRTIAKKTLNKDSLSRLSRILAGPSSQPLHA